jgi:hypothetical protein
MCTTLSYIQAYKICLILFTKTCTYNLLQVLVLPSVVIISQLNIPLFDLKLQIYLVAEYHLLLQILIFNQQQDIFLFSFNLNKANLLIYDRLN